MNVNHHLANTKYTIDDTIYDVQIQNNNVVLNFFLPSSPLAVATAAKHGIVVILNSINEINTGQPTNPLPLIPVALAVATDDALPESSIPSWYNAKYELESWIAPVDTPWDSTVNVAITFSLAINPVIAETP